MRNEDKDDLDSLFDDTEAPKVIAKLSAPETVPACVEEAGIHKTENFVGEGLKDDDYDSLFGDSEELHAQVDWDDDEL